MSEVKETNGGSIGGESLRASPKVLTAGDRKLLKVELRPGDTTYVSWKKLMRDASKVNGSSASDPDPPPNANPNLESPIAPGQPAEIETNDQPHSNRFNAVIEKIERLYKGNDSSDGEELDGAPDDDEYDTEDSFIDDAELDEYFEVDNSAVKHDGFYVNRGKLEQIEPSTISNQQPKKRRRRDSAKPFGDAVDVSDKHTKLSITARRKGNDSSDGEELDGAPDDDEYDTEDSFIDDVELDEYFEVDNSAVKNDGFYGNRGKLEQIEPSTISNQQPKKRRRKDSAEPFGDAVDVSDKHTKLSITARRKDQSTASESPLKRKYNVAKKTQESPLLFGAQDANTSLSLDEVKHSDRANHQNKKDTSHKSKETGSSSALHQKYNNKGLHQQSKSQPGKFPPNVSAEATIVRQKENNGMHELANAMGSRQSSQVSKKDGSIVKSKTLILEKAIRELEKVVTESRPSAITENQEADTSSQAVKRRLPRDVKLKLAKVARIAASQGKLSAELTNRLMSIVGHLIQLRSLKRNLKIMIDMGDSANREKDTRFQRINNEVLDMIKAKVSLMESQATKPEGGTSDDFQDSVEKPSLKKFVMDAALEDKLCDLYDIFIEGLDKDEDQGPQIRKLYVNLAKLWPNRLMDNHGIKRAICRAKERQKALYGNIGKEMDQTKMKKSRKQLVPKTDWTAQPNTESVAQRQQSGEEMTVDPNATSTSVITSQTMVDRSNQEHEKLKGSSSSCNPVEETRVVKRKTEAVMAEKQIVLALKKPEQHPQPRVIPAPQNLNIPQTTPDLNLPS